MQQYWSLAMPRYIQLTGDRSCENSQFDSQRERHRDLTTALWSNNRQVAATIAKESLACGDTDSFNQLHYEASLAVILYVIVVVYSSGWKVIMRIR